ncbi:MAG: XisI protein [Acidobacteriota bacterium]|mgnify:CR=1 FL=1
MDKLERYRGIIEQALSKHVYNFSDVTDKVLFDRQHDNYLILRQGWKGSNRVQSIVVHLEILNGKIWVQEDWLEHGIATDLEEAGIPKSDIVLGFHPAYVRPHTEYAVA